jgi:prepilin-type N-terminal cleavage/methylation domain-containing protein
MKNSKGMTLIEMLIVVAILAILYSMASAQVMGMQLEAKVARAKGDLKTLKFALDSYLKENKGCPRECDYQRILYYAKPTIVFCDLHDPFGTTMNCCYPYDTSANKEYYVVYSIGPKQNGKASVRNDGKVLIEGEPIFETNGYD